MKRLKHKKTRTVQNRVGRTISIPRIVSRVAFLKKQADAIHALMVLWEKDERGLADYALSQLISKTGDDLLFRRHRTRAAAEAALWIGKALRPPGEWLIIPQRFKGATVYAVSYLGADKI